MKQHMKHVQLNVERKLISWASSWWRNENRQLISFHERDHLYEKIRGGTKEFEEHVQIFVASEFIAN